MVLNVLTKRSSVLGLPIGSRRPAWGRLAMLGGAVAVTAAGRQGQQKVRAASEQLQEPLEEGKQVIHQASEIGDQVSNVSESLSGGGGGLLGKAASTLTGGGGGGGNDGEGGDYTKKLRLVIKLAQDVAVPRTVAYNQWTQYPDFPSFMKGVESVEPEDEMYQKWTAKVGPSRRTWKAEVTEQVPDERIQWEGSEGAEHSGVVTFHELDENLTRVQIEMEYFPNGFVEKVGNLFLSARRRARKDLRLFKHYMELEAEETGAWRGEISDGEVIQSEEEEGGEQDADGEEVGGQAQDGGRSRQAAATNGGSESAAGQAGEREGESEQEQTQATASPSGGSD